MRLLARRVTVAFTAANLASQSGRIRSEYPKYVCLGEIREWHDETNLLLQLRDYRDCNSSVGVCVYA